MTHERFVQLIEEWRAEVKSLQGFGADAQAKAVTWCADDLERAMASDDETVNLTDGAKESGYSADYLGRLVKQGRLKNYGRPHAPRIRRADLPRKATSTKTTVDLPTEAVRAVFRKKAS